MSSINGIQGISPYQDVFSVQGKSASRSMPSSSRSTGVDTVSLSPEALALLGREATGDTNASSGTTGSTNTTASTSGKNGVNSSLFSTESSATNTQKTQSVSGKVDFFKMLMESLFIAQLDDSSQGSAQQSSGAQSAEADPASTTTATAHDTAPQKTASKGVFADSDKAASIKKVMTEMASGKADMGDIAKAMAVGTGKAGTNASVASGPVGSAGQQSPAKGATVTTNNDA